MKTVVITGANAGIGFATARFIAGHPDWHVVLACRNPAKADMALKQLRGVHRPSVVSIAPLDLFSLDSINGFVNLIDRKDAPPLHGLVLNAGGINMIAKSPEFTNDGFEHTFQLNFFGHFVLTNLLMKKMKSPARIVFVSSDLHDPDATRMGKFNPPRYGRVEEAAYARGPFANMRPMSRYATAKMFAMMCAHEIDRRLRFEGETNGITVNSWSPGVVPTTQAGRNMPAILKAIMTSTAFVKFMGSHLSTEDEAGRLLGSLIVDARFSGVSGRYFDGAMEIPSSIESRDHSKAAAVWEQSMRLARLAHEQSGAK